MPNTYYPPFHTGNVIKSPEGDFWVVSNVNWRVDGTGTVSAVSFDSENCSACWRLEDYEETRTCLCGDHPDFHGEPQEDCEFCHGTGRYVKKIVGWEKCKVLAPNVQAFIMNAVKRSMGLM